jgi:hypothetical protein
VNQVSKSPIWGKIFPPHTQRSEKSPRNSQGSNYFYTFKGIADNVKLVNLRVLDQNGAGTDSQVIAAIQMAIQLKSKYNIRVINLSLGRPFTKATHSTRYAKLWNKLGRQASWS